MPYMSFALMQVMQMKAGGSGNMCALLKHSRLR